MGFGKLTKQELSTELYKDLKVELATTPADVEISGRTLVNLLGRAGNAIYKQATNVDNGTLTYDGDMFVLTSTETSMHSWLTFRGKRESGKYYIALADVNTNTDGNHAQLHGNLVIDGSTKMNGSTKAGIWETIYISAQADTTGDLIINPTCGIGVIAKYKNIRAYEITKQEYDDIYNISPSQLGEKYPYVDDIKCVVNPYVECNENLFVRNYSIANGKDNGTYEIIDTGLGLCFDIVNYSLEPNTTYTINAENLPDGYIVGVMGKGFNASFGTFTTDNENFTSCYGFIDKNGGGATNADMKSIISKFQSGEAKLTLVKGSTPKSYDECHNSRMMLETKLYDGEKITRDNSGKYVKNSEWVNFEIVQPSYSHSSTGYKVFTTKEFPESYDIATASLKAIRYDGSIIQYHQGFGTRECVFIDGTSYMILSIPNSLTGWGDSYTPTQEEVRVFFLGWRMRANSGMPYNGEAGEKQWDKLWCGIGTQMELNGVYVVTGTTTATLPTTMNDQGYTPYKIIYKKETPTLEEVKTHGSLVVKDGIDVKVGSGLVLGELDSPKLYGTQPHLNAYDSGTMGLNYKCDTALKVYQGSRVYPFVSGEGVTDARQILGNWWCYVDNFDDWTVDYMIRETDTVTSFLYTITSPQSTQEALERTIEELSNTNEKLSAENRELHNKIESLPQASNPNLLINGDFQVWQRGTSFTDYSNKYSTDRWKINADAGFEITKQDFGVRLKTTAVGTFHNFEQLIELPKYLRGKDLTLTIKLNSAGVLKQVYGGCCSADYSNKRSIFSIFNSNATSKFTYAFKAPSINSDILWVGIQTLEEVGATLDIEYIKLEVGDKATPHTPKPYSEELAMCQRYYEKLKAVVQVSPKTTVDGKYYCSSIPMVEKRITPSVTPTDNGNFINVCIVPKENISTSTYENNSKMVQPLIALPTSVQYSDSICIFWFDADAEIY